MPEITEAAAADERLLNVRDAIEEAMAQAGISGTDAWERGTTMKLAAAALGAADANPNDTIMQGKQMAAFGVNEDGTMVRIQVAANQEGGSIYLDMPSGAIRGFIDNLGQLLAHLVHIKAIPPKSPGMGHGIGQWKVGGSSDPGLKGMTAIVFDEGTPNEVIRFLKDLDALKIADAIEQKVFKGLSVVDQRSMIKEVEKARNPLILPPGLRKH